MEISEAHSSFWLITMRFLKSTCKMLDREKRKSHYLSSDIQIEFIKLCGRRVLDTILKEREEAIYFSVICDAIPDISHTERNVVLISYVIYNNETEYGS